MGGKRPVADAIEFTRCAMSAFGTDVESDKLDTLFKPVAFAHFEREAVFHACLKDAFEIRADVVYVGRIQ